MHFLSPAALLLCVGIVSLRAADDLPAGLYAEITTSRGTLVAELFPTKAPLTVSNFVGLAEGQLGPRPGKPFFDGLTFHRVVPGFVVQGGDPLGTGEGGPGYEFPDEFVPGLRHDAAGILSMANSGPDTNGSQFFITLAPVNRLNYLHSVFGRVVRGLDVLPKLQAGDAMTHVVILRIGDVAKAFHVDAGRFAKLCANAPKAVPAHFEDPDALLPTQPPRAKLFDQKLANVERATGTKIYARVVKSAPPKAAEETPEALTARLARQLGVEQLGALAVYFADTDSWTLWIGRDDVAHFGASSDKSKNANAGAGLEHAVQDFLAAAKVQAAAYMSEALRTATPDHPITPGQKIKYSVDAVIDSLIFRLE